jgi:hypothetical protein
MEPHSRLSTTLYASFLTSHAASEQLPAGSLQSHPSNQCSHTCSRQAVWRFVPLEAPSSSSPQKTRTRAYWSTNTTRSK